MLEYSERSKGYRVYNTETQIVEESIHVRFDDKLEYEKSKLIDQFAYLEITYTRTEDKDSEKTDSTSYTYMKFQDFAHSRSITRACNSHVSVLELKYPSIHI
jgi:hypothetical protein